MFTWKLDGRWPKEGRPNAHQLALGAKLSYPVATRILANEPMARVDAATLGRLATYFRVKPEKALTLLEYRDD